MSVDPSAMPSRVPAAPAKACGMSYAPFHRQANNLIETAAVTFNSAYTDTSLLFVPMMELFTTRWTLGVFF